MTEPQAPNLITGDGQVQWRGTLLGAGTPYRYVSMEGWLDLPDARDGDVDLANQHGAQPGQLLLGRRIITLTVTLGAATFTDDSIALQRITTPDENPVEEPLVVQHDGIRAMVMARCIGRIIPTARQYAVGYTQAVIRWRATNPRRLHLPQRSTSTSPPSPGSGGLVWPLVWPLVWGSARAGGEVLLTNAGNTAAQPVWRITGESLGPVIRNADTGQELAFNDDYQLPSGQHLTLNHADRTVLLDTGVSRSNQLASRGWFVLPPGTTRVRFDSVDGQGLLECLYYDTSL